MDWYQLKREFEQIKKLYGEIRANWTCREDKPEDWRLVSTKGTWVAVKFFEPLAKLAGKKLLTCPYVINSNFSEELLSVPHPLDAWLKTIDKINLSLEIVAIDDGIVGKKPFMYMGKIDDVVNESILLCLKLCELEEEKSVVSNKHGGFSENNSESSITSSEKITIEKNKKIKDNFDDIKIEMEVDWKGNYKNSSYSVKVQIKNSSKGWKSSTKHSLDLAQTYMPYLHLLVKVAKEGIRFVRIKALKERSKYLDEGKRAIVQAFTKVIGEDSRNIINVRHGRGKRLEIPSKNIILKEPPKLSKHTDESITYLSTEDNQDLEAMPTFRSED